MASTMLRRSARMLLRKSNFSSNLEVRRIAIPDQSRSYRSTITNVDLPWQMSLMSPWRGDTGLGMNSWPFSLMDQNFGLGLFNDDLMFPVGITPSIQSGYLRPWRHLPIRQSGTSSMLMDKDGFKVNLDVQQFRPEEVSVKVVDNCVIVEGNHEERSDEHGYVSRHFRRRYMLPQEIEGEKISSTLSSDGVLCVCAPRKGSSQIEMNERVIPITQTQMPAIKRAETTKVMDGPGEGVQNSK